MVETEPRANLSLVLPVHNGAQTLSACLQALVSGDRVPDEIVLVDDASTDGSAELGAQYDCVLVQLTGKPKGAAFARNRGVEVSRGEFIVFVDADVVVQKDTLGRLEAALADQPGVAAVFGSYDDHPPASGFVTRYKNLLHHYVHQHSQREAFTFWSGCGAIRRDAFYCVDGFDERYMAIEDIELGSRLRRAGYRIQLRPEIQAAHLKRWTLVSMLHADIFCRAVPWSRLLLQDRLLPDDLNLDYRSRLSAVAAWLSVLCLALSVFWSPWFLLATLLLVGGILGLNLDLFRFFARREGLLFAGVSVGLHTLYFLYSSLTFGLVAAAMKVEHLIPGKSKFTGRKR